MDMHQEKQELNTSGLKTPNSPEAFAELVREKFYQALELGIQRSESPFLQRLMKDNKWKEPFAQRASEEYLKFISLAACSSSEVTPSETVDIVWHTHLIFTESYWSELCSGVLGRQVHHHPGTGTAEDSRFPDQYKDTYLKYIEVFGTVPPKDIWARPKNLKAKDLKKFVERSREKDSRSPQSENAAHTHPFIYADSGRPSQHEKNLPAAEVQDVPESPRPSIMETMSDFFSGGDGPSSDGGGASCGSNCSGGSCGGGGGCGGG